MRSGSRWEAGRKGGERRTANRAAASILCCAAPLYSPLRSIVNDPSAAAAATSNGLPQPDFLPAYIHAFR